MRINKIIALLASLLIIASGQAMAGSVTADANPKFNGIDIAKSTPFVVEITAQNDFGELLGASFLFRMYSDDGSISNINHRAINPTDPGFPLAPGDTGVVWSADDIPFVSSYNDSSCLTYNGFSDIWTMFYAWTGFSFDGVLPDTVNYSGITMGGWAAEGAPILRLGFSLQIDEVGRFCIDSTGFAAPSTYDWLFDDPNMTFNGPYCWDVVSDDVNEIEGDILPKEFNLGQNYPNPFNSTTNIEFALPKRCEVNISVFNILGQKVNTIANGEFEAGRYVADWDGTAENGVPVASGMYFYKIEADEFTTTKKLMLLK